MQLSNQFKIVLVLPVFVFASLAFRAQSNAATFQGLGNPPGRFHSWAADVSADGSVVVGHLDSISEGAFQAFRWTPSEGMVLLGYLPDGEFHSMAEGVSPDGSVVVGRSYSAWGIEAFRWTESDGMIGLGDLPGGNFWSHAYAVSEDGLVIVGFGYSASGQEAFHWTAANGMVALGRGQAYDVSADGTVVVGTSNGHAFRWTEDAGMVELGDLPGGKPYSGACAVTADGAVVVGGAYSALGLECFRWTSETGMVSLGPLQYSVAVAVSIDGSVILANVQTAMVMKPYIWDSANGMRALQDVLELDYGLDLTGWDLWEATAMSDDGSTIVGSAMKSDGYVEAWIATIHKPTIQAGVNIVPNTLNLQSQGRWVSCYILLPQDCNAAEIDRNSILLEEEIPADRAVLYGRLALAKFSRRALQELLSDLQTPAEVELLVSGQMTDGTIFEGTDTSTLINTPCRRSRNSTSPPAPPKHKKPK
jgi:probable HAF family extracellular repeat protein